jgi:DNA-binding response OmpR family regulator
MRPTRILIIDAHRDNLGYYRRALQTEGYDVELSSFQEEQQPEIERLMPSLIIIDLLVDFQQEQEAWDLLKVLKNFTSTASIPVFVCLVSFVSQNFSTYLQDQQIPVIFKPFNWRELIRQIHIVLTPD